MPSGHGPGAAGRNEDKATAATSHGWSNSMIFPAELAASTQWGRAVCMERHGMPVRPIMATAACAVLVTPVRAPAGGRSEVL